MNPEIWSSLPTELTHTILSHIPQGRHIFPDLKIKKDRLLRWLKILTFLSTYESDSERMVKWFVKNNTLPIQIKDKLAKFVEHLGSSTLKDWLQQRENGSIDMAAFTQ